MTEKLLTKDNIWRFGDMELETWNLEFEAWNLDFGFWPLRMKIFNHPLLGYNIFVLPEEAF